MVAHQVCQQILTEATKDDDNTVVDIVPEKTDDALEDKQRDERFVEEKTE